MSSCFDGSGLGAGRFAHANGSTAASSAASGAASASVTSDGTHVLDAHRMDVKAAPRPVQSVSVVHCSLSAAKRSEHAPEPPATSAVASNQIVLPCRTMLVLAAAPEPSKVYPVSS